jgi:signal transduction histidine kinase
MGIRRLSIIGDFRRLASAVRLALLAFCFVVAALDPHPRRTVAGALLIAAAALIAYLPVKAGAVQRLLPTLEACVAAVGVIVPPADRLSLLPYLLAPAFAAGLLAGLVPAVTAAGMAAAVLMIGHLLAHNPHPLNTFVADASQWVLLALAVGVLAAWIRRLTADSTDSDVNQSYEAAYELLSQLRTVSRQLSAGLDSVSLGQGLLQSIGEIAAFSRGAVFVRSDGGRLVPLALSGASAVEWDTSLAEGTALGRAWDKAGLSVGPGGLGSARPTAAGGTTSHAVLPLRMGSRSFGLVAVEFAQPAPDPAELAPVVALVDQTALRLETALLFGEIQSIATAEERRRLAREIHDGIAQELASLGYAVDDLVAEAGDSGLAADLKTLRREVTRIVSELRLSIFDLRSEVQAQVGLGSALSDYVRAVSVGAGFSVHVVLDEAPDRLPIAVEAELLRVAQEAVTNARKHAHAENLWVTCRVDPPYAQLRVEDDGGGLGPGRHDSFGLEVMRERAARIGGVLTIGARDPHGTFVDVQLGVRPATVAGEPAGASTVPGLSVADGDSDMDGGGRVTSTEESRRAAARAIDRPRR